MIVTRLPAGPGIVYMRGEPRAGRMMTLSPELQILALNGAALLVGYLGLYPALRPYGRGVIALADLAVFVGVMTAAAYKFAGSGIGFSLIVLRTNWAGFTVATWVLMTIPFFLHLNRSLNRTDEDAE